MKTLISFGHIGRIDFEQKCLLKWQSVGWPDWKTYFIPCNYDFTRQSDSAIFLHFASTSHILKCPNLACHGNLGKRQLEQNLGGSEMNFPVWFAGSFVKSCVLFCAATVHKCV